MTYQNQYKQMDEELLENATQRLVCGAVSVIFREAKASSPDLIRGALVAVSMAALAKGELSTLTDDWDDVWCFLDKYADLVGVDYGG